MDNNNVFAIYTAVLVAGAATVITAALLAGGQSFPPVAYIVEHLALSLLFRSAYKSFDGENWLAKAMDLTGLIKPVEVEAAAMPVPDAA